MHERNGKLLQNARTLRKNMTKEERRLWYNFLRNLPVRFRRQEIIGNFIVDFYCASAHIAIELDGSQHYDPGAIQKDQERTQYLESQGVRVLRFTNLDIKNRFNAVCEAILMELGDPSATS